MIKEGQIWPVKENKSGWNYLVGLIICLTCYSVYSGQTTFNRGLGKSAQLAASSCAHLNKCKFNIYNILVWQTTPSIKTDDTKIIFLTVHNTITEGSYMIHINKSTSYETWHLNPFTYCSVWFTQYCSLPCRAAFPQPVWAAASGVGTPGAGRVEELHCPVRLCRQRHHQSPSGGPHHQPERTRFRGTRQHPGRSESSWVLFSTTIIHSTIKTVKIRLWGVIASLCRQHANVCVNGWMQSCVVMWLVRLEKHNLITVHLEHCQPRIISGLVGDLVS